MTLKIGGLELATPGDVIAGGGGAASGFAIDAFFFSGGASPTDVAIVSGMGALAVKYAAQLLLEAWRRQRKPQPPPPFEKTDV